MPGLVPGIHVFLSVGRSKDVDGRDKPGHDVVLSNEFYFGGAGHGFCGPRIPSNAFAMPSTPRSSKRRPTIWTPIGKPLASKPPLIEIAGFSAMFHGMV